MKITVGQIIQYTEDVEKLVAYVDKQVKASQPNSPEREQLAVIVAAVNRMSSFVFQLTKTEVSVRG